MSAPTKKQVLFVTDSLGCGGAEKSLTALLQRLDYTRMDVDLAIAIHGGVNTSAVPPQVRVIGFLPGGWKNAVGRYANALALRIMRLCGKKRHGAEIAWHTRAWTFGRMRKRYDVAIAYQQGVPTFFVATKVDARRKYAWINVDLTPAGYSPGMCRKFYDRYDGVAVVSEMLRKPVMNGGFAAADRLMTIYDIVDSEAIRAAAAEGTPPAAVAPGTLRIVTVGRMTPQKNYPLAVRAAAILKEKGLKFVWHFVGDGIARDHVQTLIHDLGLQDCIRLEGMRPNPYPFFAAADIYVQTSSFEGFGLTLTEARLLGRPVITTDFAVARDQIRDGINGLISDMTPEGVAEKILILASDSALRGAIASCAAAEVNHTARTESRKVNTLICAD